MDNLGLTSLAQATEEDITLYAEVCCFYCENVDPETLVGNLSGHQALHDQVVRPALRKGLRFGDRVLDFACGIGRVTALAFEAVDDLSKPGYTAGHVVGVDVSRPALARATQIVPRGTFVELCGDGHLPFPPESFDAIVSMIALQHIQFFPVRHRYFQEFARILRPKGTLLLQLNADDSGEHIRWFERGTPLTYTAPDVICDEQEIRDYLPLVEFDVQETWRTEMDTPHTSWNRRETGRKDGWLWVFAQKGSAP